MPLFPLPVCGWWLSVWRNSVNDSDVSPVSHLVKSRAEPLPSSRARWWKNLSHLGLFFFQDFLRVTRLPGPEDFQLHCQRRLQQLLQVQRVQVQEEGGTTDVFYLLSMCVCVCVLVKKRTHMWVWIRLTFSINHFITTRPLQSPRRPTPCASCGPSARPSRFATSSACSTLSRTPTGRRTARATSPRRNPAAKVSCSSQNKKA